jgi:hypothetical protein
MQGIRFDINTPTVALLGRACRARLLALASRANGPIGTGVVTLSTMKAIALQIDTTSFAFAVGQRSGTGTGPFLTKRPTRTRVATTTTVQTICLHIYASTKTNGR